MILILPVDKKRVAMALDASLVYSVSTETNEIAKGGSGHNLAEQSVSVLHEKLDFGP